MGAASSRHSPCPLSSRATIARTRTHESRREKAPARSRVMSRACGAPGTPTRPGRSRPDVGHRIARTRFWKCAPCFCGAPTAASLVARRAIAGASRIVRPSPNVHVALCANKQGEPESRPVMEYFSVDDRVCRKSRPCHRRGARHRACHREKIPRRGLARRAARHRGDTVAGAVAALDRPDPTLALDCDVSDAAAVAAASPLRSASAGSTRWSTMPASRCSRR